MVVIGLVVCAGHNAYRREVEWCRAKAQRPVDWRLANSTRCGCMLLLLLQISRCRPSKQYSLVIIMRMSFCIILCFIVCVFYFLLFPAAFVPIKLMMMIGLTQQHF